MILDVCSSPESLVETAQMAIEVYGHVDVVVNNAGMYRFRRYSEESTIDAHVFFCNDCRLRTCRCAGGFNARGDFCTDEVNDLSKRGCVC